MVLRHTVLIFHCEPQEDWTMHLRCSKWRVECCTQWQAMLERPQPPTVCVMNLCGLNRHGLGVKDLEPLLRAWHLKRTVILLVVPANEWTLWRRWESWIDELLLAPLDGAELAQWIHLHLTECFGVQKESPEIDDEMEASESNEFSPLRLARLLKERLRRQEEIRQPASMGAEISSIISHRLRTPLTSIRGYIEMLLAEPDLPVAERAAALRIIDSRSAELVAQIENLLNVATHDCGSYRQLQTPVDMVAVLQAACNDVQARARDKQQQIVVNLPTVPARIHGVMGKLQEVFETLLIRAISSAPSATVIGVRLERNGAYWRVRLTDTRTHPADLEYEPEPNSTTTLTPQATACAVGWSAIRRTIKRHDGTITVAFIPSRGALIECEFPAVDVDE